MARPGILANLSNEELVELQTILRSSKVDFRIKERAGIILDWHKGKSYDESQLLRKVSRSIVTKWRRRFQVKRLEGLSDAAYRSGKPVVITEAQKNKLSRHISLSKAGEGCQVAVCMFAF